MNDELRNKMEEMKEMVELIPKMQNAVSIGLARHFNRLGYQQEHQNITTILHSLRKAIEIFDAKYVLDIIFVLSQENKFLYFNELKSVLPYVNVGTLSKRLKSLEEDTIIKREIHEDERPIRVSYSLTEMGHGVFRLLLPMLVYVSYFNELKTAGIC